MKLYTCERHAHRGWLPCWRCRAESDTDLRSHPYRGRLPAEPETEHSTSREAADSMETHATNLRAKVLALIEGAGVLGMTDDEIEVSTGLRHQTASARRRELVLKGLIEPNGRRKTRSGRWAKVWVAAGDPR